ncbi:inositol monophosphatase family protein [Nitrospirillum pindoramense]|uniref:Fructose-1,6-bisphosphatase/inositol monophosphatase family enzyme n=1 Tax=Nitrospirillum amazonense TaxID=28077 RepID=A0A560HFV8_9PROT|nr:inositol monophosphatase family protein [Nitrospirillum amazonense]TWB44364.1 fructose-1,6-bisphosphatase/inositol monophosphatase family enzyme [Nitrospirillum amazonense]
MTAPLPVPDLPPVDLAAVDALIRSVAETEILPRFQHLAGDDVREKGPGDLVTVADEASERALTARLTAFLPGSTVVGEEAVSADAAVLDRLLGADPVWIVDPIDGTANFVAGKPRFGVIVALSAHGRTVAGWIHDPVGRRTVRGRLGQGAWLVGVDAADPGTRCVALPPVAVAQMRGIANIRFFDSDMRRQLTQRRERVAEAYTQRCSAHDYLDLLTGQAHFSLNNMIKPWDHAAGAFLYAEAGGYAAKLDDSPYGPTDRVGGLLMAPDAESWRALHSTLFNVE